MSNPDKSRTPTISVQGYMWALVAIWTLIVAASLAWNVEQERLETREVARMQARTAHAKDLSYRRWNAGRGGVYVPVTEETQPNPYLAHLPERDITTLTGKQLTLINPAYMTRLVHELEEQENYILGHITSLKPIRPENAADPWETEALQAFETGKKEVSLIAEMGGETYMRLMRPLFTEEVCLKCHAAQGYKVGDIRGGISVSVPMEPLQAIARMHMLTLSLGHGLLWLVGLGGIIFGTQRLKHNERERRHAEEEREKLLHDMEERAKELRCMYGVAESIRTRTTLEENLQDLASLIPTSWLYPEITRGKVIFDGKEYISEPFTETEWKQSSDIVVNGKHQGSIEVYYMEECPELDEGPFMTEERNLINGMAKNISEAIERKQAEENLNRENAYVRLLQEVAVAANESSNVEVAFQLCIDRVCELTAWPVGHVYLLSKDRADLMEPIPIWHVDDPDQFQVLIDVTAKASFEIGIGLPGRVLASGKPAWIIDVTKDKNFTRAKMAKDIGVKAGFAFPVLIGDKVHAVLEFFSPQSVVPDERLLEVMAHIGAQIGRVMERKQAKEALQKTHDELERRVKERTADLTKVNQQLEKDIAKRKQAEREVINISEKEQRRIAQDLHDDLGQQLIGIAFMFEVLSDKFASGDPLNIEDFTRIEALTAEAIERLHAVALDLHPISVEGSDLSWSLQKLTENMQANYGISCNFTQQGELPHFERELATNLYRIAQEAANNAVKHGAPSQVHISLDTRDDELILAVKDDGVGIEKKELVRRGMGLKNMEYRSDLIGAKLDIFRAQDGGTVVSCIVNQNSVIEDGRYQGDQ